MKTALSLLLLTAAAAAGQPLQHHDIRPDKLPAPGHTESATNPPRVVKRPADAKLHLPPRFSIAVWEDGFSTPRNMILAPNGDVFVADSDRGLIVVLRDQNGDARVDQRYTFASSLSRPFGLAFGKEHLYVGNTDAVVRFRYRSGQTAATEEPQRILSLPPGGHWTRNLIFNRDRTKLYVAVGSRSNVNDESDDPRRAAILEINPDGSGQRVFASGLRNPVGLAWNPRTGALWTSVNERDGLGDDLVPDYITAVKEGGFYGWPWSYIGKNADPRRAGERPDMVARAIAPSLLIQAHSAALGTVFYDGTMFPERYRGGAFVALHGSWNRGRRTGYSVIHVPFRSGEPSGGYDDFIEGWAPDPADRAVWGRPVGLLVLGDGSLLVSDDGSGVIWRVTYR
jgi:glucose/arabinose dehydrogenase